MKNSIVNIEGVSNDAFGTGFVIDSDEKGIYILTCQHVLDDVEIPVVENILAKVIANGKFIDMAVLYISKLQLNALRLQTEKSESLDVEVIGFSTFNKTLTQKKHIKATLYEEPIELHSKEINAFYTVRKIKANDGFDFDRGNSGSPVICKNSGAVIAMISNKEGANIAYAIDIENLKTVWRDVPSKLFNNIISKPSPQPHTKPSSFFKYIISIIIVLALGFGIYNLIKPPLHSTPHYKKPIPTHDIATLEKMAFSELINKDYKKASILFNQAYNRNPKHHNLYEINRLLQENAHKMHEPIIRDMVLRKITKDFYWGAPKGTIDELKMHIRN